MKTMVAMKICEKNGEKHKDEGIRYERKSRVK